VEYARSACGNGCDENDTNRIFLVADPIGRHIVQSLAKPGGNVTGATNFESAMGSKWVGLLQDLSPTIARVGNLTNTQNPGERRIQAAIEEAALGKGLSTTTIAVEKQEDIKSTLELFAGAGSGGLVIIPGIATNAASGLIIDSAARLNLPAIFPFRYYAESGGLASYGVDQSELARRSASQVAQILQGVQVEGIPVEGPTRFEFVLNLKTARRPGIVVPPTHLIAACDRVAPCGFAYGSHHLTRGPWCCDIVQVLARLRRADVP
jgi:ABC-type uncharacterized transport system substrate-binding protein